jgi:adenylate kinase
MEGKNGLPPKAVEYLKENEVPALMETMLHELTIRMPEDPVSFLIDFLKLPQVPRLVLAGPPGSGNSTQCERLHKEYGIEHISTGHLLREEVKKGTKLGTEAEPFMTKGELVPDHLILEMLKTRLESDDVKHHGWVLDGFPKTRRQALEMQSNGLIPNKFLLLECSDEVIHERIEGRRIDPETGNVYHVTNNPPPEDEEVLARLEQRTDDSSEAVATRLADYHRNMKEIREAYDRVTVPLDATRSVDDVWEELRGVIDALQQHKTAPPSEA